MIDNKKTYTYTEYLRVFAPKDYEDYIRSRKKDKCPLCLRDLVDMLQPKKTVSDD